MYCTKCGWKNNNDAMFCANCGALMHAESNIIRSYGKYVKAIAITNIVLGAILFLISLDWDFDWSLIPFFWGIGVCITGILQLLKKETKVIAIIQVIFGTLCTLASLNMEYDWEYIGFFAGGELMVIGILRLLKKPDKIISIIEIIFSGVILLLGWICFAYEGGAYGLCMGAAFLVEGILSYVRENKIGNEELTK